MATGQGYRLTLYLGTDPLDFENAGVEFDADEVDTSGSLIVDEATGALVGDEINGSDETRGAFTDCAGATQTLIITFSQVVRNPLVLNYLALLQTGDKLTTQVYSIYYNGQAVVAGEGLYVRRVSVGAVVRGAAPVSFTLRSTQLGYTYNAGLLI